MENIKIETGDNLLVSSKSFVAKTIQKFEGIEYNHSAFFIWLNNILYVIEAEKHGISLTKFDDYVNSDRVLLVLKPRDEISNDMKSDIIDFVLEYAGHTPYDYANLLFFQPIRFITKYLFGKDIWIGRSKKKSTRKFICSEWTAFIYNKFLGFFKNWNEIAPIGIFYDPNFEHYKYIKESNSIEKI